MDIKDPPLSGFTDEEPEQILSTKCVSNYVLGCCNPHVKPMEVLHLLLLTLKSLRSPVILLVNQLHLFLKEINVHLIWVTKAMYFRVADVSLQFKGDALTDFPSNTSLLKGSTRNFSFRNEPDSFYCWLLPA